MTSISSRLRISIILLLILFIYKSYSYPLQQKTPTTLSSTQTLDTRQNIAFSDLANKQDESNEFIEISRTEKERQLQYERQLENERWEREEREREHRERERGERERADEEHHNNDDPFNRDPYGQYQWPGDDNDNFSGPRGSPPPFNTATPTSNIIVTTIIVTSTESPTSIYSVSNGNPSKQRGSASADHQVSDPNSSSSSNSEESSSLPLPKGRSNRRKLVIALSVVGAIAGIALIAGLFLVTRMQLNKRKRKQQPFVDEEAGIPNNDPPNNFSSNMNIITPPPTARLSSVSTDHEIPTINPFIDPNDDISISILPSAPPQAALSMNNPVYANYRQNQTLLLSQSTVAAEPSAPTVKELEAMHDENPFKEEQDYSTTSATSEAPRTLIRQQSVPSQSNFNNTLQNNYNTLDLPPPPAYTPSAPPLYALPTITTPIEQQESSRRHSISSCSIISVTLPHSLRRGSGSLAHINAPFT